MMTKARILVVEDEIVIAMEIKSSLQNLGYEVTSIVTSGEHAVEKAETDQPDLILMDIRIKGDTDGIETAEIIRSKYCIPIVFVTAYLDQDRIDRAKITLPFGYVLKPIQERDLKVTLEMALYVAKVETDRRKIQEQLQESEKKFRALFAASPDAILLANRESGLIIDANEAAATLFETTLDRLIGRHQRELHPDQQLKDAIESFKFQPQPEGEYAPPVEIDIVLPNLRRKTVEITGKIIEIDKTECVLGNFRNITERKQIEQRLQESLIDLELAQQIAEIGNWQYDPELGVPVWSEQIYRIYDRDPKLGPPHVDEYKQIYDEEQYAVFLTAFQRAVNDGNPYDIKLKLSLPGNNIKWLRAICRPQYRKSQAGYFLRGTIQDITSHVSS